MVNVGLARTRTRVLPLAQLACALGLACAVSPAPPTHPANGTATAGDASSDASCAAGRDVPERLRLAVTRSGSSTFFDDGYRPVADYLAERLNRPVDLLFGDHYDDVAAMLERGDADVAVLPPLAYVRARDRTPCLRLLLTMVSRGDIRYSGYVLVREDSKLNSLEALAGRTIGFVDRTSASGFLFPMAQLAASGLNPRDVMAHARFLGEHLAVLRAVVAGEVDAGASFYGALRAARDHGIDVGSLRVLGLTGRIPFDAVVARPGLDVDVAHQFAAVLGGLNATKPEGRKALRGLVDVDGYVPSTNVFYDPVRDTVRTVRAIGVEGP